MTKSVQNSLQDMSQWHHITALKASSYQLKHVKVRYSKSTSLFIKNLKEWIWTVFYSSDIIICMFYGCLKKFSTILQGVSITSYVANILTAMLHSSGALPFSWIRTIINFLISHRWMTRSVFVSFITYNTMTSSTLFFYWCFTCLTMLF